MTIIWTHQGDGIENTLDAFSKAWAKGVTHFETDIQATADGVLVLSHDKSIYRLTGVKKLVSELTFSELQKYKIFGKYNWSRLDELISAYPDATISVDMKSENSLNPLVMYLGKLLNTSKLVIGSFNANRVKRFRELLPQISTSLTVDEALKIKLGIGISEAWANRYAMVPYRYSRIDVIDKSFISRTLSHSISCHAWTINSKDEMLKLIDLGVSGIITDDVDLALSCVSS
jgi:glycerophosphoryl diester phosphodiesterase